MHLFTKQKQTQKCRERTYGDQGGRVGRRDGWRVHETHVHTAAFTVDDRQGLPHSAGSSLQCRVAAWLGGKFGREWIHVYVRLSPFAVQLKLWQTLLISYMPIQN